MPLYTVARLPAEKVDQAFPLMRAVEPGIDLARWRAKCAAMAARDGAGADAVFVASGPAGHYRGLCIVEAQRSSHREPAIVVSTLFIDGVLDANGVARAMLDALAAHCKAQGCTRLQIATRGTDETVIGAVAAASAVLRGTPITIELV